MRRQTTDLQRRLAEAQAADDALAAKCEAMISFLEHSERCRSERDEALLAAIREDQANFLGQSRTMRAELTAVIAELRGTPLAVETAHHPAAPPHAGPLLTLREAGEAVPPTLSR